MIFHLRRGPPAKNERVINERFGSVAINKAAGCVVLLKTCAITQATRFSVEKLMNRRIILSQRSQCTRRCQKVAASIVVGDEMHKIALFINCCAQHYTTSPTPSCITAITAITALRTAVLPPMTEKRRWLFNTRRRTITVSRSRFHCRPSPRGREWPGGLVVGLRSDVAAGIVRRN